jgi:hypothetical protein
MEEIKSRSKVEPRETTRDQPGKAGGKGASGGRRGKTQTVLVGLGTAPHKHF